MLHPVKVDEDFPSN